MTKRSDDDAQDILATASTADVSAAVLAVYREDGSPYGDAEGGVMRWTREAMAAPVRRARIAAKLALQSRSTAA